MEFGFKVFVLFAFAFNLVFCQYDCPANTFRNDKRLLPTLSGWLYTLYTTEVFGINEIFNCDVSLIERNIYCQTTVDDLCCRSFNVTTKPVSHSRDPTSEYFKYLIETAPDCPQQLEEYAHMKLLAARRGLDGSNCLILWTCRPSREGYHAFCTKQTVSNDQKIWIARQFAKNGKTPIPVTQEKDYRNGKCFPKSVQTGRDNIFIKQV